MANSVDAASNATSNLLAGLSREDLLAVINGLIRSDSSPPPRMPPPLASPALPVPMPPPSLPFPPPAPPPASPALQAALAFGVFVLVILSITLAILLVSKRLRGKGLRCLWLANTMCAESPCFEGVVPPPPPLAAQDQQLAAVALESDLEAQKDDKADDGKAPADEVDMEVARKQSNNDRNLLRERITRVGTDGIVRALDEANAELEMVRDLHGTHQPWAPTVTLVLTKPWTQL